MDNLGILLVDMDIPFLNSYAQVMNQSKVLRSFQNKPQIVLEYHMDVLEPVCGLRTIDNLKLVLNNDATYIWKIDNDGFKSTKFHGIKPNDKDGFTNVSLESHLRSIGVKDLIIMGYHRDSCVYATAKSAVGAGFNVHTSVDVLVGPKDFSDQEVKDFYENKVKLYHSVDELIEGVSI